MAQAITESTRFALQQRAREVLGEQEGDTLMAHLPPVGWADVATKQDIASLRESIASLRELMDERFSQVSERFSQVSERFSHVGERLAQFATKADMERGFRRQAVWVASVFFVQQASFVYMVERLAP